LNIPFYRAWSIVYLLTQPDDGSYFAAQKKAGVAPKNARATLIHAGERSICRPCSTTPTRWLWLTTPAPGR
jgi:hypothetical protein